MRDTQVQLFGQIRDAVRCVEPFNRFLGEASDVFISTWGPNTILTRDNSHIPDTMSLDEVYKHYWPKILEVEHFSPKEFNAGAAVAYDGALAEEAVAQNVYFMFYKMFKVNHIAQSYDYKRVIRTRMDIELAEPFPDIYPEDYTVYIPEGFDHRGGYNDVLCVANPYVMESLADFFNFVPTYISRNYYHPESLFRLLIERSNFKVKRFPLKYKLKGNFI
jgi:hypothetical protein